MSLWSRPKHLILAIGSWATSCFIPSEPPSLLLRIPSTSPSLFPLPHDCRPLLPHLAYPPCLPPTYCRLGCLSASSCWLLPSVDSISITRASSCAHLGRDLLVPWPLISISFLSESGSGPFQVSPLLPISSPSALPSLESFRSTSAVRCSLTALPALHALTATRAASSLFHSSSFGVSSWSWPPPFMVQNPLEPCCYMTHRCRDLPSTLLQLPSPALFIQSQPQPHCYQLAAPVL
ncbi:hypothetical protein F5X68DRAFT_69501 [Plectosphaerella plurivora]|uniref:Uncharacterized protein n=1 Tax=Plectosphaerella plurivora TaxID=936078 RepID=A0A9P9ACB3_9PEZI|nr:hypothetical protein F5X68DRAFT_69501 [Plectosphaerella plurivora]